MMKFLDKMYKYKTMLSYCLKYKKMAESINPRVSRTSNNKTVLLSKCDARGTKNENFSKNKK